MHPFFYQHLNDNRKKRVKTTVQAKYSLLTLLSSLYLNQKITKVQV